MNLKKKEFDDRFQRFQLANEQNEFAQTSARHKLCASRLVKQAFEEKKFWGRSFESFFLNKKRQSFRINFWFSAETEK